MNLSSREEYQRSLRDPDLFTHSSLLLYQYISDLGFPFVSHGDDHLWALRSGVENPYFNFLLIKEHPSSSIENAMSFFSPLPFECTFDSKHSYLVKKCEEWGLSFGEKTTGMLLNMEDFSEKPLSKKEIVIQAPNSETHMRWWMNLTALEFGLSKNYIKDFFYPIYASGCNKLKFSLCLFNDVPAAASLVFIDPPHSSIVSLVTRSQFRSKGISFYLLQEALSFVKLQNASVCVVQATSLGSSVYKKLGFQTKQELLTYIFKPDKDLR